MKLLVSYQNGGQRTITMRPPLTYDMHTTVYTLRDANGVDWSMKPKSRKAMPIERRWP